MKKSEKIISALLTMVLGLLLIVLRADFISIILTVAGISLIVFGGIDLVNRLIPPAVVKLVVGLLIIICGWVIVEVALYIIAAFLLIAGILLLYDKIKHRVRCTNLWMTILEYALPAILIAIGILLLFNQSEFVNVAFVISGILTIAEGALLLIEAFSND